MPRLIVNSGSPAAWEIQLKPGSNFIGRGFANDFKIPDGSVSGSHCQITVNGQSVVIKDLGSSNGTFVNRSPIQEVELPNGATVHLGGVVMTYHADGSSSEPSVAVSAASAAESVPRAAPALTAVRAQVRITAPPPRTADVAQPAVLPPAPIPPAISGTHNCKSHPRTLARFFCHHCQHYFCELCVNSRPVSGIQQKFCRHCGAECVAVQAQVTRTLAAGERGFFARLPRAFMYPLQGGGVLVLIVGTILFGALKFFGGMGGLSLGMLIGLRGGMPWSWWGLIMQVFVLGYLFAYMQNIIHSTAAEETELPPLPSMANFWEDILLPCLQFVGLTLICFAPAIALSVWAGMSEESSQESSLGWAVLVTFCLGALYFPMGFLAAAVLDSVLGANPLTVVPAILKAPLEYLVTLILLAAVFAIRWAGDGVIPALFPRGLTTHSMPKLAAFVAAEAFWAVMCLYLLTVGVHILGLLYLSKKDRFAWLNR